MNERRTRQGSGYTQIRWIRKRANRLILVGVEQAILLAMVLSLLDHVRRGYRASNAVIVADDLAGWHTVPIANPGQIRPGLLVYFFSHSAYYANAQQLSEEMIQLAQSAQPRLSWLCLDAAAIGDVDFSAATALDRCHLTAAVGEDSYYGSIREVLNAYHLVSSGMSNHSGSQQA